MIQRAMQVRSIEGLRIAKTKRLGMEHETSEKTSDEEGLINGTKLPRTVLQPTTGADRCIQGAFIVHSPGAFWVHFGCIQDRQ